VYRAGTSPLGSGQYGRAVQVASGWLRRANENRLVCLADEWQARVDLRVDSHGAHAELASGGYDPPGDLTTIGD
jgi:hypothetical protein